MAELSHRALRELIEGFGGCDIYYTEMISAGALLSGGPFESWYADAGPCPEKVVFQLVGADPGQLAAAAALLDRRECAGIDINMGCAAPAITRTGAGVRWMEDPGRAGAMIGQVRKQTKKKLSVKLRLGPEEDFEYLLRFCRRLEAEGADFITLHPRTAREKFRRRARWEYVARLREALGIPVAGNGDIADAAGLARRAAEGSAGGWDAVMVGRLAVKNPWIFDRTRRLEAGEPADEKNADLEETALRFLDLLSRRQPPEFHLSRARRFFHYYCDNFIWAEYLRNLINREETLGGIAAVIRGYCGEHPEERNVRSEDALAAANEPPLSAGSPPFKFPGRA
jgi:tRNA-dihydrouridine synthase